MARRETVRVAARCVRRDELPGRRRPVEGWVEVFAREGREVAPAPPGSFVVGVILDGLSTEPPIAADRRRDHRRTGDRPPDLLLRFTRREGAGGGTKGAIAEALHMGDEFFRRRSLGALIAIRELTAAASRLPLRAALAAERQRFPGFFEHRDRHEGIDAFLHRRPADFGDRGGDAAPPGSGPEVLPKGKRAAR